MINELEDNIEIAMEGVGGQISLPITINQIKFGGGDVYRSTSFSGGKCGDWIAVRPCGEKYGNKTYLGVLIGEVALSMGVTFDKKANQLGVMRFRHNPMIYIPQLSEVVWGCESWWGKIRDPAHLRQITDDDIQNVWYVKALAWLETQAANEGSKPES